MNLTIHRGTHEIGGSCVEIRTQNTKILLDFGMPLTDGLDNDFDERRIINKPVDILVRDGVLYPIGGLYAGTKPQVDAILISHSHKDHFGFLKYANPEIPVYISDGAKKLIDVSNIFTREDSRYIIPNFRVIKDRTPFDIGDFRIVPYIVDHSGFEAMSFYVAEKETGKSIFYSGDFRATGWKHKLFDKFVKDPPRNVDYLLMEGTMIGREEGKYTDEQAVFSKMVEILNNSANSIILSYCSGQNIDRIVTFYKAIRKTGALFVIDPYTACVLNSLKSPYSSIPQVDWKDIRVLIADYGGEKGDIYIGKIKESSLRGFIPSLSWRKIKSWQLSKIKRKALILMRNTMIPVVRRISGIKGSKLVYSLWDGYLKKDNADTRKFRAFVDRYNLNVEHVHTSGHATEERLEEFAEAVNPRKKIIPIHTRSPEGFKRLFGDRVMELPNGKLLEV